MDNTEQQNIETPPAVSDEQAGVVELPLAASSYDADWLARENRFSAIRVVADLYRGIGITSEKAIQYARELEAYLNGPVAAVTE